MTIDEKWGYEHPEVVGPNALMFFTWDLSKTIEHAFKDATADTFEQYIPVAQDSIDALMQKYIDLKADPDSFDGQRITLRLEQTDANRGYLVALQTSEHLESKIIAMQERVKAGHS